MRHEGRKSMRTDSDRKLARLARRLLLALLLLPLGAPKIVLANNTNRLLIGGPEHPLQVVIEAPDAALPILGAHLNYNGGRIVTNLQVIQVLWGSGNYLPNVSSIASPSIATFYQGVLNSPYVDWLDGEYNSVTNSYNGTQTNQHIGRGSFSQQIMITPST